MQNKLGILIIKCSYLFYTINRNLAGFARNVKRVGATLAVALIQCGGKPRPYTAKLSFNFVHLLTVVKPTKPRNEEQPVTGDSYTHDLPPLVCSAEKSAFRL